MLSNAILLSSTAYLSFFESPSKQPSLKVLGEGRKHVLQLLLPYKVPSAISMNIASVAAPI
jgi:hypothetical protein